MKKEKKNIAYKNLIKFSKVYIEFVLLYAHCFEKKIYIDKTNRQNTTGLTFEMYFSVLMDWNCQI